ncbi:hypothetical protein QBC38DRAFT_261141 [Podospora fimiseda]|uniref:Uncharacterized protein n=1 Tax=Podospora fimiseda TaxID=252190 RepID=A0AAN7BWZ5_9PEZI|nr:hypothetical protein QBC38DRAFT_261141 [Podospora fimiseda]
MSSEAENTTPTTQEDKTKEPDQPQQEPQQPADDLPVPASPPQRPSTPINQLEVTPDQISENQDDAEGTCAAPPSESTVNVGETTPAVDKANETTPETEQQQQPQPLQQQQSLSPALPLTAATTKQKPKYKKNKDLTRDERIGIQYLRRYGKFTYQEIFLRCERRFTIRQIQDACNGPATPKKKGRRPKMNEKKEKKEEEGSAVEGEGEVEVEVGEEDTMDESQG